MTQDIYLRAVNSDLGRKMSEKKVARSIVIVLGIACILLIGLLGAVIVQMTNLNSQITTKDNAISQLNSQVTDLQNEVSSMNSTAMQQQTQLDILERFQNLTHQIFFLSPVMNDYGEWLGSWSVVTGFSSISVSGGNTSNFQIFSPYHLWRFNYTFQQSLDFSVVEVVGSQEIFAGSYQGSNGPDHGTIYLRADSISVPLNYYLKIFGNVGSWTITVEELGI
jgi:hypothetical protein